MAASRNKSNDRTRGVQFTKAAARAIASTVRSVQRGDREQPSICSKPTVYPASHYLVKTSEVWPKDAKATLTIYVGEAGSESSASETVEAWNKHDEVPADEWVLVARANGTFYRVASSGSGLKRGTFSAPWTKGSTKTVSDALAPGTTYDNVMNYFANVSGGGTKACAIAKVGTEWILIAAEC